MSSPIILTPESISALRAGPELDRFVHLIVLDLPDEGRSDLPCYSETTRALDVLAVVPIEVGRFAANNPEFTADRPYYGRFAVGPATDQKTYMMKCGTPEMALCKASLLYKWAVNPNAR